MRFLAALSLPVLLAACGVDGAPKPPADPGVSISGEARIGVVGKL